MNITILTMKLTQESDVLLVRQRARHIGELLGFNLQDQTRIAAAVSEIARNAVVYASGGDVQFIFETTLPVQTLIIRIKDHGPGIRDLPQVMGNQVSYTQDHGIGIVGAQRLMDRFHIVSAPHEGTTVILGKYLPKEYDPLNAEDIRNLVSRLIQGGSPDIFNEAHQQNRELLFALEELRILNERLIATNQELEKTNRGVVALYAELDEQKQWLSTVLTSIGEAVIATDDNGYIVLINPTAQQITGWSRHEAEQKPLSSILNILDLETQLPLQDLPEEGLLIQAILVCRLGNEISIEMRRSLIRNEKGDPIGVVLVFRDITKRRQTEIENELLYGQLKEAVRARDEFLSVAAHELRTPVTSMRGFAEMLMRQLNKRGTVDSKQLQRALETIDKQSIKLSSLIGQLLDISRLEAGRLVLEKETIDLPKLLRDVVTNMQKNATEHSITLESPPELSVTVDPIRLEQVLVNLLDNAIKYSPAGESVEVDVQRDNAQHINIAVTDHGIGIPPERRERIFDRFFQAHGDGYLGGMGLGLYISRQIIDLHNGRLSVDAPVNGGTRFVIQLPIDTTNVISHKV